jgi:hypothetical protein
LLGVALSPRGDRGRSLRAATLFAFGRSNVPRGPGANGPKQKLTRRQAFLIEYVIWIT